MSDACSTHSLSAPCPTCRRPCGGTRPSTASRAGGWFLSFHCFTKFVKVTFFRGTSLRSQPPGESKTEETRYVDIHEDEQFDEDLVAGWIRQAAELPGWIP